jgi:hypothetical protein
MLQFGKAKERRGGCAQRQLDRAVALFDLVPGELIGHLLRIQIGMRPGMRTDGVTGRGHLLENFGMVGGMLADRKEHRLGAFISQRLEHGGRIGRPRAVVEGQHDFLVGQKVELLEMLKAKAGAAGGVDFHHAGDAQRIGIGAVGFRLRHSRGLVSKGAGRLNLVAGGSGFGGGGWKRRGVRGADCLWGGHSTRGCCPKPYAGNHSSGHDTRQHQTQRVTHGYSFSNTKDKNLARLFMRNRC